jgi:hypothetical protein
MVDLWRDAVDRRGSWSLAFQSIGCRFSAALRSPSRDFPGLVASAALFIVAQRSGELFEVAAEDLGQIGEQEMTRRSLTQSSG